MFTVSWDTVWFELLEQQLAPDVLVVSELSNTVFDAFPLLLLGTQASESSGSNSGWSTGKPLLWDVTLTLTVLATPQDMDPTLHRVQQALLAIQHSQVSWMGLDGKTEVLSLYQLRTRSAFTSTGQEALVGGKTIAQKTGTFEIQCRERTD